MTFIDILADIRKKATSEQDKGHRFERLMRAYLLTDPLYANSLETVWLWADFPFRNDFSGKDTGIDFVARTVAGDFWAFSKAGEALAGLHLNYETLPPHPDVREDSPKQKPSTRVQKMRFGKLGKEEDKSAIIYNDDLTLWNIPLEVYEYVVNGKSAIEWIMERYQVTTHKESGIVNDPNLWCDEHADPRYIIDLIKRIVTLSLETRRIVKSLPALKV